ncbi:MAG: type VI secretion system protein TssA [Pseudomonadales bacterium]|nr:type VI secretion system protein TssA [Pseudomonadales bacterium]
MSLLSLDEISQLATNPIPGPNPAGENVRLEQAFESIEQEIAKLDSFTSEDPVRWGEITSTARQILEGQSKDLLVACFLTRSLCEVDLLDGLHQGLLLGKGIAETFWDQAFPPKKRMRGRSQAFEWLVEKCHPLLAEFNPSVNDLERIKQVEDSLAALDDMLVEKMSDHAPNLAEFRQAFRRLRQGLEAEQDKRAPSAADSRPTSTAVSRSTAQDGGGASVSAAAASAPAQVASERDLMAVYRLCQEQLRNASQYLAAKNVTDPEVFRINRFITWLGVIQLPPATQNKTQLRPISKEKMDTLNGLYQEKRWHDLVMELEPSLVKAPFWITGQRMVAEALDELGATGALESVKQGVRAFVQRLPEVVNLSFNDDTPFADEKTRQWVQQIGHASSGTSTNVNLEVDAAGISKDWEDALDNARALAREKKIREALALFQGGVSRSTSLREQALWRFNQARFCFDQGMFNLALPLLENLDTQLNQQGVAEWEPQVSKRVLELLLRCYQQGFQQGDESEERNRRIEQLHARLCKFDLALAFDLATH